MWAVRWRKIDEESGGKQDEPGQYRQLDQHGRLRGQLRAGPWFINLFEPTRWIVVDGRHVSCFEGCIPDLNPNKGRID